MKEFFEIPILFQGYPLWYKILGLVWLLGLLVLVGLRFFISPTIQREGAQHQLRSEVVKLLRFPDAMPNKTEPPSLLEKMLVNQIPARLFDLLMRYDEKDVANVPENGEALHTFLNEYYQFRQRIARMEDNLTNRIGQMVQLRFRAAWRIHLRYVIMRFGGMSKDTIIARGNFLNFDITWDDVERVYVELSKDPSISKAFAEIFASHKGFIENVNQIQVLAEERPGD